MSHRTNAGPFDDGGNTLIEVLVAVVIIAIAALGVLAAMATSIEASERQRQHAQAGNVLVSAAESVKKSPKVACAEPDEASYVDAAHAAASAQGWDPSLVTITAVRYWDGTTYGSTCYDNSTNRLPLQLITVRAVHPAGEVVQTLTFVKGPS